MKQETLLLGQYTPPKFKALADSLQKEGSNS